jgi:HSP20 family protein
MNLVRYRNRRGGPLGRLHDDMDRLFGSFFADWPLGPADRDAWWPAVDVSEQDDMYVVKAELPGVKKEDVEIQVRGHTLTIRGAKEESTEEKDEHYHHVERHYGSFRRDIHLPGDVEFEKVKAACQDGVLTVTLPKSAKAKARKIPVKS